MIKKEIENIFSTVESKLFTKIGKIQEGTEKQNQEKAGIEIFWTIKDVDNGWRISDCKEKKLGIVRSSSVLRPIRITFWLGCLPNEEK